MGYSAFFKLVQVMSHSILNGLLLINSLFGNQAILESAEPLKIWTFVYHRGKVIAISSCLVSIVSGILAFLTCGHIGFLMAVIGDFGLILYTQKFLMPGNLILLGMFKNGEKNEKKTRKLIQDFGFYNHGRTLISFVTLLYNVYLITWN